ncbi:MAG: hypothetical protein IPL40_11760 [Proteobacteria bacterium]|nr:hypothetical protein [Pseudomonadota bacterium]
MFRLIRGLLGFVLFVALIYAAVTVTLGERTLWQHLCAIAGSSESRALVDGVKQRTQGLWGGSATDPQRASPGPTPAAGAKGAADPLTADERSRLRRLIRQRLAGRAADAGAGRRGAQRSSNSLQKTTSARASASAPERPGSRANP